jgi:hypothetical protein
MAVLAAIAFIVAGVACLFGRDLLWDLTQSRYRADGLVAERTPEWDLRTIAAGVGAIHIGAVVLLIIIFG